MEPMMPSIPEDMMPGAGFDFRDVTQIFTDAAAVMEPGSFVFMDDFTLQDAMGAFEIGEPRLDSGLIAEGQQKVPFHPGTPLLPEELCWILDRAFSYEMAWHSGDLLSHTVFTLLYAHSLAELDPDFVTPGILANFDPSRPPELLYLVLRAWVMGLLKCCDLSWRELSKGGVQDVEDWQGEKCDVSLLEGVPVSFVLSALEVADTWLLETTNLSATMRDALRARITLRKTILTLMQSDIFGRSPDFPKLLTVAKELLEVVRLHPISEPATMSPAHNAFDPFIARHLKTFVPLRLVPLPTPDVTWKAIDALVDGWQEAYQLSRTHNLSTWQIVGDLRLWLQHAPLRAPYLRSLTQSTFYDGLLILNKYSFTWMIDRFFLETLGMSYGTITKTSKQYWDPDEPPFPQVERILYKIIPSHIRCQWLNPPRRRRHLAKSLFDWHDLYCVLTNIVDNLGEKGVQKNNILMQLPKVALLWRLSAIREVILSGLQLELYSLEERPFAYLYATEVMEEHLSCLDSLLNVVPGDSTAFQELQFQFRLLTALQAISTATFVVCMPLLNFDWSRTGPAFFRRYKWAFRPEYDGVKIPPVAHPEPDRIISICSDTLQTESFSPSGSIELAQGILNSLIQSGDSGGWAGIWTDDRIQFLRNLVETCTRLSALPTLVRDIDSFDVKTLKWDAKVDPWFPLIDGN